MCSINQNLNMVWSDQVKDVLINMVWSDQVKDVLINMVWSDQAKDVFNKPKCIFNSKIFLWEFLAKFYLDLTRENFSFHFDF